MPSWRCKSAACSAAMVRLLPRIGHTSPHALAGAGWHIQPVQATFDRLPFSDQWLVLTMRICRERCMIPDSHPQAVVWLHNDYRNHRCGAFWSCRGTHAVHALAGKVGEQPAGWQSAVWILAAVSHGLHVQQKQPWTTQSASAAAASRLMKRS